MTRPAPDFVVVGAPKCGTTAIYRTLQQHPDLFLPAIKEPQYFAFEYGHHRAVENAHRYDKLFSKARDTQLCGEGSVIYLSSETAISAIMERRPDAKIIAVIRNPIELFISWHNQCLRHLDEDVINPERAWRIQKERALGRLIPPSCHEPRALRYRNICSLGTQIERLFCLVPEHQRLILVFDDIRSQPGDVYKRILEFLAVRDDGRRELLRENEFTRPRSILLARLARAGQKYSMLKKMRLKFKPLLNEHGIFWVERFFGRNLVPASKPPLSAAFERELQTEFLPDVMLLEKLLKRDLSEWRQIRGATTIRRAH